MNINNLARQHANRLAGSSSIAAMCLDRLNKGEPVIAGSYKLPPDKQNGPKSTVKYFDPYGNEITRKEASSLVGTSPTNCRRLFKEYGHDLKKIYCGYGLNKLDWQEKLL